MTGKLSGNIKCIVLSLLLFAGFNSSLYAQTRINGTINQYGRVTSIGVDYVIVNDVTQFNQFHAGDTILLLQMKGIRIYPTEDASYGSSGYSYGEAGKHEFLVILSVEGGTKKIVFKNNIVTAGYDVSSGVQIIKVPSHTNAIVDAKLTCPPWDSVSKTGGVLALIIGRTLTLNADIDVSGLGFLGGAIATGKGECFSSSPLWQKYAYSATSDSAGFKGDGLAIKVDPSGIKTPPFFSVFPLYAKGQGKNFNGGGGGNGKFSGGGGGSNYGSGGKGGNELGPCAPITTGGLGGIQIVGTGVEGGLFLGGGGGGSTYQTGTPTTGARGGGIIILICDTLKGNNKSILSGGATPLVQATGNAGAGGGGGGGSIALYLQSYSTSNLTISVNGGKGGNNAGTFGEGGGGGGGLLYTSSILPVNVTKTYDGGFVGNRSGSSTGTNGLIGRYATSFVPILNGFLFNSVSSSVNGSLVDSICSNIIPKKITGTTPVGGSGNYNYEWLKGLSPTGPWTSVASGPTLKDYTPAAPEPVTFWIRRFVKDNTTLLQDTSKALKIVVQPAITGNNIKKDTLICQGADPLPLLHSGTPAGGYGNMHYHWLQNTNNIWSSYESAVGTDSTKADFNPSALNITTYYKRKINSGHCVNYSNTVSISVLPSINGNSLISTDQVICEGSVFSILTANNPTGGTGAFIWQWQDSAALSTGNWLAASGINNGQTHSPDTSRFTLAEEKRYFKRVAFSDDTYHVCKSASNSVLLTRYHKIKNNIIAANSTICSGFAPNPLTGLTPVQGNGIYGYVWQQSNDGSTWPSNASGTYTAINYSPPVLTASTWYRRVVNSSVCTNTSNIVAVTVQPKISNNTISLKSGLIDSTICSGATPRKLFGKTPPALAGGDGSAYSYRWKISIDGTSFANVAGATAADYQDPLSLTSAKWYQRVAISGMCKDSTNSVKINVLPTLINTIPALKDVCINTASPKTSPIVGLSLSGGRTNQYKFLWESSPNGSTWTNMTPDTIRTITGADLDVPKLSSPMKYRRKVWSGPYNTCFSASNIIDINIIQKPYPVFAGRDTVINTFEYLYKLRATEPVLGNGTWSVKTSPNKDKMVFDAPALYNTTVRNLASFDPNVLLWSVENGVCKVDTTVTIVVLNIDIPDGLSPNNDSRNDLFLIKGLDFSMEGTGGKPSQSIDLKILNSAGTQVFHTSNEGSEWKTWDGKDDGGIDLPEGTYYYLLKIQSNRSDIKFKPRTGFIILKRK